jgi:DNA invertase Pin-like site-specific DNA recombinase
VELQAERCLTYAKLHGYKVLGEFSDKEKSGARADNRPGLQRALDLACTRKAVVIVTKLDRLARNTADALAISERLRAAGAELASLEERIDTTTPTGRFFFTVVAGFAELEREQIAERTSLAMLQHQDNGRRMTRLSHCPFGFRADPEDPSRLVEHAEEQGAIVLIQQRLKKGWTLRRIARSLDEDGVPCRRGGWNHVTIGNVISRAQ